jgi:hypothetical protein
MVMAPGTEVVALATGTVERTLVPPECRERGVAGISAEEFVKRGEYRQR